MTVSDEVNLNYSASFRLWRSLARFLEHWPGQTLSHISQRQVGSTGHTTDTKDPREKGRSQRRQF